MATSPLVQTQQLGTITVLSLTSRCEMIEDALLEPLGRDLLAAIQDAQHPHVVLDLSATRFFGSGFIELLLRVWKNLQLRPNSRLALCGLQEYCREVLEITHLDQLWPIVPTVPEAVDALNALA